MNTVIITETEAHIGTTGYRYVTGRGIGMSKSIKTAYHLAREMVGKELAKKSVYGGVPIFDTLNINGKEINRW